jgi:N6-L-threonylcarbamoyladenine synthase
VLQLIVGLRNHLKKAAKEHNLTVHFPPIKLCTDNAAMIACAAAAHLNRGHTSPLNLGVKSRLDITEVMTLY